MWGPVRASDIGATRADSYVGNGGYVVRFGSVNSYILPSVESRITPEALRSLTWRSNSTMRAILLPWRLDLPGNRRLNQ